MATQTRSYGAARNKGPVQRQIPAAGRSNGNGPNGNGSKGSGVRGSSSPATHSPGGSSSAHAARTGSSSVVSSGVSSSGKSSANGAPSRASGTAPRGSSPTASGKPEPKIIFQKFFHSVGPRTYASQVKELSNGNHLLVLTEGKRDEETDDIRKTRLFIYGEDFNAFFRLLHDTATFIRANPIPEEVREKRARFWSRKNKEAKASRTSRQ